MRIAFFCTYAILTLATFLVLGLIGTLMAPHWQIQKNTTRITVQSKDTTIASKLTVPAHEGTYQIRQTPIKIRLTAKVTVHALVREPIDAPADRPACLLMQGAGTGKSSEVFGDLASSMASAGITTLVPDKRMDDYTMFHRNYVSMAHDYGTSFDILKRWPGVDAQKVGLYAESEGTWISSIMTAQRKDIAFTILTSPPVYSGRQQMAIAATSYFKTAGAPLALTRDIPKLTALNFSVLGLDYADFDSLNYISHLTQPTLINYGTRDLSMPIEQGAVTILAKAKANNNQNVTVRYYDANHQMRIGDNMALPRLPLATGYTQNLDDWINGIASGTSAQDWKTPMIAGSQPNQLYAVPPRTTAGLITSLGQLFALMLFGTGLCVIAFLLGVLRSIGKSIRRSIRRQRNKGQHLQSQTRMQSSMQAQVPVSTNFSRPLIASMWITGLLSIASTLGILGYVIVVVSQALTLQQDTKFLSLLWIVLRVASIVVILAFSWLCTQFLNPLLVRLTGSEGNEPDEISHVFNGLQRIIMLCVLCGSALLMGSLAFWGLY
ncbi:alpha/beta hydrolase family protein [Bifidobacterium aquikefiricola]|uniref:Acyl-CoA thioester hydrolase/BAAT C-terminal domain-containing protein n=1 Tax=Bifidobacterium aquikefiricola TaxID=3059038 RepID=A0AB39U7X6_9BIFI